MQAGADRDQRESSLTTTAPLCMSAAKNTRSKLFKHTENNFMLHGNWQCVTPNYFFFVTAVQPH